MKVAVGNALNQTIQNNVTRNNPEDSKESLLMNYLDGVLINDLTMNNDEGYE